MTIKEGPFEQLWAHSCDGSIISVATTPNCSLIAAATMAGSLYLLDEKGDVLWRWQDKLKHEMWAAAVSADGLYIAAGSASKTPADGFVYVFDREGHVVFKDRIGAPVWSLSFSTDGSKLAVAGWNNHAYIYTRTGARFQRKDIDLSKHGAKGGAYGISLSGDAGLCIVASYDYGVFVLDDRAEIIERYETEEGLYNLTLCERVSRFFAGTRSGGFIMGNVQSRGGLTMSRQISQRPVCGIQGTADGQLLSCGSFDGRLMVVTQGGDILWEIETEGEIWSTRISSDGGFVCVGGGDHMLRLIRNHCPASALQEIAALENTLFLDNERIQAGRLRELAGHYLKHGLVGYGFRKLGEIIAKSPTFHTLRLEARAFLQKHLSAFPSSHRTNFDLGCLLMEDMDYIGAARHFQKAANAPALRSVALRKAAQCFAEKQMLAAASSSFRQAREQHLDGPSRQILFNLARSYEDRQMWRPAASVYELLVSWDVEFRNAYAKWNSFFSTSSGSAAERRGPYRDYSESFYSLLGPDAPREVEDSLKGVLAARKKEIAIGSGEAEIVEQAVEELLTDDTFSRGITGRLEYTQELFLRYDFGLPEDEMKKFLETVNALPAIKQRLRGNNPFSLDVGSATGRYPCLFTKLGFRAFGIDTEARAVDFARTKAGPAEWPKFVCGSALDLDRHFEKQRFQVITCMMGTFNHIERAQQSTVLQKMFDLLEPGGVAIISLWDPECQHLAYLSMYDETQKELIRKNSPHQCEMRTHLQDAGFQDNFIKPFCLLPQVVIYDLGIERLRSEDIRVAAHADLVARALFAERHGEMYLAIGEKRN